ncbi:MAG: plastocyanin/azurin family copper-binding protein, partial [Thermomicrobiales bacterium]
MTGTDPRRVLRFMATIGVVAALAAVGFGVAPAAAQDEPGHPAHIHLGTCDKLGEIALALSNVGPGFVSGGNARTAGKSIGATADVYPVAVSVTTVNASLTQITDGDHAINIHESKENIQNYIACANIGGTIYGEDLIVGLETRNGSGYSGIAVLHGRGDKTTLTIYLSNGLTAAPGTCGADATAAAAAKTTPAADTAPTAAAAPAAQESVAIADFSFTPNALEVAAGTTVTWTNTDTVPHTATADDGSFDSGPLAKG